MGEAMVVTLTLCGRPLSSHANAIGFCIVAHISSSSQAGVIIVVQAHIPVGQKLLRKAQPGSNVAWTESQELD